MNIKILGTSGSITLPKPLCQCKICREARFKGKPYSRNGCSIYIEDIYSLFDTPEDIIHSLNDCDIKRIDNVFYTHLDPDHTMGIRFLELIRKNYLDVSPELNNLNPVNIYGLDRVIDDISKLSTAYGSFIQYYLNKGIIKVEALSKLNINDYEIFFIPVVTNIVSTIFVIKHGSTKIAYAPCDIKPFPENEILNDLDLLIIGNTIPCSKIKNGVVLEENHEIYNDLFSLNEVIDIKNNYNIKEVIITHLEEDWGMGYDDYKKLEKKLDNIRFAYDNMQIMIGSD